MTDDVFSDWKDQRFVVASRDLLMAHEHLIVLTDVSFWNSHYEQLKDWCDANECEVQGMAVVSRHEWAIAQFVLRWS